MWEIKINNLDKIQKLIMSYPMQSAMNFNEAITKTLIAVERYAIMGAPVDTGRLRSNWRLSVQMLRGELVNTTEYAIFVAKGTKPHWPPIKAITKWANRKGIPPFLVARSIARKGTKANPFFDNAVSVGQVIADDEFQKALDKTIKELIK
ncbi:MAG: HK97 gp10 family phage protein [bacterium]